MLALLFIALLIIFRLVCSLRKKEIYIIEQQPRRVSFAPAVNKYDNPGK